MKPLRYAFIIRIWFELEPNTYGYAPALRGSVQPVERKELVYFSSLDQLAAILAGFTGGHAAGTARGAIPAEPS